MLALLSTFPNCNSKHRAHGVEVAYWWLLSFLKHPVMWGNAWDFATCPIAESLFLHGEIRNVPILLPLCTLVPSEGPGKIWEKRKNHCPQNPQALLEPTTVPGSLCLLIWDSGCFMFYYWWPKAKATNKCLCWQQGASFPGLHFRGGKSCFKAYSLCMVSIFSSRQDKVKTEPASRVENSVLTPMLGPLEDIGACSTD